MQPILRFYTVLLINGMVFAMMATAAAQTEQATNKFLALHPENSHYFLWRDKPLVLVTSGEHYGALLNIDFDYVRYFNELQAHGLNHTRIFSGVYRENAAAFQITDNTLAPLPNRYLAPWARSNQTGYRAGGNRFDLTKWDSAYFERLKDLMNQAASRGIVVEMTLFCPMYEEGMWDICPMKSANNVNGMGTCLRDEVYTRKHRDLFDVQLAVTRKIVSELREFDNLYYEVCNEPYFGGVTMEWQHAIVDAIVEAEKEFPQKHLISLNIANGRSRVDHPHPAISIFNFHYCVPPDTVRMNFSLKKVIGENETGFRGSDDILYRTEAWDFLLSGGALYNNLDYSFSAKHPDGTLRGYKSPGGGSLELRQQLGILKNFMESIDFIHMRPDSRVVRQISSDLTATVLTQLGEVYAIYFHVPLPDKPKRIEDHLHDDLQFVFTLDLPAATFAAEWLNTLTGKIEHAETIQHAGGDCQLRSPRFANDIALRLKRTK